MAAVYGYSITDVLLLEKNSAKGITSATFEDGASINFSSLEEMRKHIAYMRERLGIDDTPTTGFVSINPSTDL